MARYVVVLSDSDAASFDNWMACHSGVLLRSTGGTFTWRPVAVQRQEAPHREGAPAARGGTEEAVRALAEMLAAGAEGDQS